MGLSDLLFVSKDAQTMFLARRPPWPAREAKKMISRNNVAKATGFSSILLSKCFDSAAACRSSHSDLQAHQGMS